MRASDYHFITTWRVEGTCGEVADILRDPLALPRWWPSVYLAAEETRPGDERGVGQQVRVVTKGWLPYTLRWQFLVVESRYPHGFTLEASGDLAGRGEWVFVQEGPGVRITYHWRIHAEKPLIRRLSFVLKPLFAANHRWAMAQGEASLKLELRRRHAPNGDGERGSSNDPPRAIELRDRVVDPTRNALGAADDAGRCAPGASGRAHRSAGRTHSKLGPGTAPESSAGIVSSTSIAGLSRNIDRIAGSSIPGRPSNAASSWASTSQ